MIVTPQWKTTSPTTTKTIEVPKVETQEAYLVFDDNDKLTISQEVQEKLEGFETFKTEILEKITTIENQFEERASTIETNLESYLQILERNKQTLKLLMQICEEMSK